MSKSFLQYWKQEYAISEGELEHSASKQLARVSVGDTVWVVTLESSQLILVGPIRVGECIAKTEAQQRFGDEIFDSSVHIVARRGTEEVHQWLNVMDIASKLRFNSPAGRDRFEITGKGINGKQLQSLRELTEASADLLEEKWNSKPLPPAPDLENQISHGAGFGNPEKNRLVEIAAVEHVTKLYTDLGWSVTSRESEKCGYDLLCTLGSQEENVEVKGISGQQQTFIITNSEVNQATSNPNFVLYIVTNALSDRRRAHRYSGIEFRAKFDLQELAFRATPRHR